MCWNEVFRYNPEHTGIGYHKRLNPYPWVPLRGLVNDLDCHQGGLDVQLEEGCLSNILNDSLVHLLTRRLSADGLSQSLFDSLLQRARACSDT